MSDLVERMEQERRGIAHFQFGMLPHDNQDKQAAVLHSDVVSQRIGMWQSEVIRLERQLETLQARIDAGIATAQEGERRYREAYAAHQGIFAVFYEQVVDVLRGGE